MTEERRGDFELEPGLDELREIFSRMTGAYNVFANVASSQIEGWVKIAADKTAEIHEAADQFIEDARAHVAQLDAAKQLGTEES